MRAQRQMICRCNQNWEENHGLVKLLQDVKWNFIFSDHYAVLQQVYFLPAIIQGLWNVSICLTLVAEKDIQDGLSICCIFKKDTRYNT